MTDSTVNGKKWIISDVEPYIPRELVELGLPSALLRILVRRGILTSEGVARFLDPSLDDLGDPMCIPGMIPAVDKIISAIGSHEPVAVYGDYDADGVTSTALLGSGLQALGANVSHYLPNRLSEGYGLSETGIRYLHDQGIKLIVTVDTGISGRKEILLARESGMDVILTDHHELPSELPEDCTAMLNPKLGGWPEASLHLSGVGVAFKLLHGLHMRMGIPPERTWTYLDLVALGTVADIVPLVGDNRILVHYGLKVASSLARPGIAELAKVAGVRDTMDTVTLGYALAPRINAAGRLSDPNVAVNLLISGDNATAARLARILDDDNRSRQEQEKRILAEALVQAEGQISGSDPLALVLASDNWHQGIIGIVASRVMDRFHRPVVLLSIDGGVAKGSGRSMPGFNLASALAECSGLLTKHGGHECAAGLSLPTANIPAFREMLRGIAGRLMPPGGLVPTLEADDELSAEEITFDLARNLEKLAPFGTGNPKPIFVTKGLWPGEAGFVGAGRNVLRIKLKTRGLEVMGVGFNMPEDRVVLPSPPEAMDAAYNLDINRWQGRESLQLLLKDLRRGAADIEVEQSLGSRLVRLYGRLEVNDRRRATDKKDALRWLLEAGDPSLVYLKGDKLVSDLAKALEAEWPHRRGRIGHFHKGLDPKAAAMKLSSGEWDILITADPLPASVSFPGLRNVILYHLCSSYGELAALLAMGGNSPKITLHMLFGDADITRQLDALKRVEYNGMNMDPESSTFISHMRESDPEAIVKELWVAGGEPR